MCIRDSLRDLQILQEAEELRGVAVGQGAHSWWRSRKSRSIKVGVLHCCVSVTHDLRWRKGAWARFLVADCGHFGGAVCTLVVALVVLGRPFYSAYCAVGHENGARVEEAARVAR